VPTVALAYSDKFAGVLDTVGMADCVADLRTLDAPAVLAIVDRTWAARAEHRARLEGTMPAVRARITTLFMEAARALGLRADARGA
jgi:colanic acid/amylovoran biosynthesis protein WcaK/AmsJ